jgi:AbrB family looped-hinge helix DNA binding protein
MTQATITSKGQVTIPKIIRDILNLHSGDKIDFIVKENGETILKPISQKVDDVFGILSKKNNKPIKVDEMNDILRKSFKRKYK